MAYLETRALHVGRFVHATTLALAFFLGCLWFLGCISLDSQTIWMVVPLVAALLLFEFARHPRFTQEVVGLSVLIIITPIRFLTLLAIAAIKRLLVLLHHTPSVLLGCGISSGTPSISSRSLPRTPLSHLTGSRVQPRGVTLRPTLDFVGPDLPPPATTPQSPSPTTIDDGLVDSSGHRERLQAALRALDIRADVVNVHDGPFITTYQILPQTGQRIRALLQSQLDLAVAMGVQSLRVLAPSETGEVLIEVPHLNRSPVPLGPLLAELDSHSTNDTPVVPLGRGSRGQPVFANLLDYVHTLVGGATGSGKTHFLRAVVTSLASRLGPRRIRILLIDPKRCGDYSDLSSLPHLISPPIVDPGLACDALEQIKDHMNSRFQCLGMCPRTDSPFTPSPDTPPLHHPVFSPLVVVIDELAALISFGGSDLSELIAHLAAMGRAAAIVLIVATQHPSVDVVNGLIKANLPSRIAFRVATSADSRVILDQSGAETLRGAGDMLVRPAGASTTFRVQAPFVSSGETSRIQACYRCLAHRPPRTSQRSLQEADRDHE